MENYTENFTSVTGDAVDAAELEAEFDAIATAIATKADAVDFFFHVTRGGTDSAAISDGVTTLLPWTTEVTDTGGCFASNKFTVPAGAAGTWMLTASITSAAAIADGERIVTRLYKNGVGAHAGTNIRSGASGFASSQVTVIVELSVSDYWEVYWDHTDSSSTRAADGDATQTFFMGVRVG